MFVKSCCTLLQREVFFACIVSSRDNGATKNATIKNITNNIDTSLPFETALETILDNEIKDSIPSYKITFMNGTYPNNTYRFKDFKTTYSNATIAIKLFESPQNNIQGVLMYDVNGKNKPNIWGKDVFGLNIYKDKFEPIGKNEPLSSQKQDCSRNGTGLYCSNYYLIGGSFD